MKRIREREKYRKKGRKKSIYEWLVRLFNDIPLKLVFNVLIRWRCYRNGINLKTKKRKEVLENRTGGEWEKEGRERGEEEEKEKKERERK